MNYFKFVGGSVLLVLLVLPSCINRNTDAQTSQQQPPEENTLHADNADLLRVLQGRWQNAANAQDEIEIEGNKMRHYQAGSINSEGDIMADAGCVIAPCNTESASQEDGWCFVEKTPNFEQCHLVLQCTKDSLQYKLMNAGEDVMSYRKVK